MCEQLARGCHLKAERPRFELFFESQPFVSQVQRSNHYATRPHNTVQWSGGKIVDLGIKGKSRDLLSLSDMRMLFSCHKVALQALYLLTKLSASICTVCVH